MAGINRSAWMAQRSAAQERESVEEELGTSSRSHTSNTSNTSGPSAARSVLQVSDSDVLDRITERLTSRLKEELRTEVRREAEEASHKRISEAHKMEGFLAAELEQTTCPICYEVMAPPVHTPTLLFPCGHTFCKACIEGHIKANNRRTCPYCREKIQSQAPNVILQQLIDGFTSQKAQAAAAAKKAGPTPELSSAHTRARAEDEKENTRRSQIAEQLSTVPEDRRDQLEHYIREWNGLTMRWRIYQNEATDCRQEVQQLVNKKDAGKLVQKLLQQELADAQRRLELIKQEMELIDAQVEQQSVRDALLERDIAEKRRRQEMVDATCDSLATERDKIRLMVKHFAPEQLDVEAILNS